MDEPSRARSSDATRGCVKQLLFATISEAHGDIELAGSFYLANCAIYPIAPPSHLKRVYINHQH